MCLEQGHLLESLPCGALGRRISSPFLVCARGEVGWVGWGWGGDDILCTSTHVRCYARLLLVYVCTRSGCYARHGFCFPSALFCFFAPLSFRFSAIKDRIFLAKGSVHVSIRWLLEPHTEHCLRRPLPCLVMLDLDYTHFFLLHERPVRTIVRITNHLRKPGREMWYQHQSFDGYRI